MPESTRLHYREELEGLETRALEGLDMVIQSLDRTLEAVEHRDIELAELVIADDDRIDGRYLEVHQEILTMLPLSAPVWLAGLWWFFFRAEGKPFRALGWAFLGEAPALLAVAGGALCLGGVVLARR